jgi:hypothetical protein
MTGKRGIKLHSNTPLLKSVEMASIYNRTQRSSYVMSNCDTWALVYLQSIWGSIKLNDNSYILSSIDIDRRIKKNNYKLSPNEIYLLCISARLLSVDLCVGMFKKLRISAKKYNTGYLKTIGDFESCSYNKICKLARNAQNKLN